MLNFFQQSKKKILIIGGSGLIGQNLYQKLMNDGNFDIYILDRYKPTNETTNFFEGNITDYKTVSNAVKGMDVVVHLAAVMENQPVEVIKEINIDGTSNIFDACKKANVKRIIYTSSIEVIYGYRLIEPYLSIHEGKYNLVPDNIRPVTSDKILLPKANDTSENLAMYAESKLFGENLVKEYSEKYKISCLCVRLGWVNANDDPFNHDDPSKKAPGPNWCSQQDATQILKLCIEAKNSILAGFYYGVSNFKYRYLSIENAEQELGYQPIDSIDDKIQEKYAGKSPFDFN